MSPESWFFVAVGLLAGYGLGYAQCWTFARKLERHGVKLSAWAAPADLQAPTSKARTFDINDAR